MFGESEIKVKNLDDGQKIFDNQFEETFVLKFIYIDLVCLEDENGNEVFLDEENVDGCFFDGLFELV